MCTCICVYTRVWLHVCARKCMCPHVCMCVHVYVCLQDSMTFYKYAQVRMCSCVCVVNICAVELGVLVCACQYMYLDACMCMYMSVYTCGHGHTCTTAVHWRYSLPCTPKQPYTSQKEANISKIEVYTTKKESYTDENALPSKEYSLFPCSQAKKNPYVLVCVFERPSSCTSVKYVWWISV